MPGQSARKKPNGNVVKKPCNAAENPIVLARMPLICIRVSDQLHAAITLRHQSLGYNSPAAYLRGLIRQDLYRLPAHGLGLSINSEPAWKRDAIDAAV